MAKNETAKPAADQLAELEIGEQASVNGSTYIRVPGGFMVAYGNTACFVPLTEHAAGELGLTWEE